MSRKKENLGGVGHYIVLAALIGIAYLVVYLNMAFDNSDNFTAMWEELLMGVLFLATAFVITLNKYYGWILYIVSLGIMLVFSIMDLEGNIGVLPTVALIIFALMLMVNPKTKAQFGA